MVLFYDAKVGSIRNDGGEIEGIDETPPWAVGASILCIDEAGREKGSSIVEAPVEKQCDVTNCVSRDDDGPG